MIHHKGYKTSVICDANGGVRRFITLTSCGVKEEGAPVGGYFDTKEAAWEAYHLCFRQFLNNRGRPQHVYWRQEPRLERGDLWESHWDFAEDSIPAFPNVIIDNREKWFVYSRVLARTYPINEQEAE